MIKTGGIITSVSIENLRVFKMTAETLNFTRAAEKCFITQPALSRMMSALEKEWQTTLFDRTTRRVALTPAGKRCLDRVNAILREYDAMKEDIKRSVSGEVRIGFNTLSGPPEWFVSALKELQNEYPGVKISLRQVRSSESVFQIGSGELDCALIYEHSALLTKGLKTHRLAETCRYAVVSPTDPLAARASVKPEELVGRSLIFMREIEEITYSEMSEKLRAVGAGVDASSYVKSPTELLLQIELTGGVGITALEPGTGGNGSAVFVPIELENDESFPHGLALAYREDERSPVIASFAEKLIQRTKDL